MAVLRWFGGIGPNGALVWHIDGRRRSAIVILAICLVAGLVAFGAHSPDTASGFPSCGDGTVEFTCVGCVEWPEAEDKDVGNCQCCLLGPETLQVVLSNAYPGYGCTVTFKIANRCDVPLVIEHITVTPHNFTDGVEVSLDVARPYVGQVIDPCSVICGEIKVKTEQPAEQGFEYSFTVTITLIQHCQSLGGTIGFWKNWDKHNTYTEAEIDEWLDNIDAESQWLVPDTNGDGTIDVDDMEAVLTESFAYAGASPMERKFLAHYLATRLDTEACRLGYGVHDFGEYDPDDYLGLGGSGTLLEIISAIESKYGTSPSDSEFEMMKNVCVALNEARI